MEWQPGSKSGKEYVKVVILSPSLINLYAEYIMWNARLDESQAGIKIAVRNISSLRYADYTMLMAEIKDFCSSEEKQHIKKQSCYFANKDLSSQSYGFSSIHV